MTSRPPYPGHCLCGAVRFEVRGPLTNTHACHCGQCRRQSGHFVVGASAKRGDLVFSDDEALTWFQSSPEARRGFCRACGSVMFWDGGDATVGINLEHIPIRWNRSLRRRSSRNNPMA